MFFPRRIALVLGAAVALPAPGGAVEPGLAGGLRKLTKEADEVSFTSIPNLVGVFRNPDLEALITGKLQKCVDSYQGDPVECDVYFNPHTLYSFYRNLSAVGVLRGQLYYDGEKENGADIFDVPEATSEIMDALMSETGLQKTGGAGDTCDGAQYRELGPGIARTENVRVSWKKTGGSNTITLLSSTIILKDEETKDLRCAFCPEGTDGSGCPVSPKKNRYSNLIILGSHLHTGNNMMDGPPPVFFCKDPPLSPPIDAQFCSAVYN